MRFARRQLRTLGVGRVDLHPTVVAHVKDGRMIRVRGMVHESDPFPLKPVMVGTEVLCSMLDVGCWFSSNRTSFTRNRTHSIKRIPVPYSKCRRRAGVGPAAVPANARFVGGDTSGNADSRRNDSCNAPRHSDHTDRAGRHRRGCDSAPSLRAPSVGWTAESGAVDTPGRGGGGCPPPRS